MDINSDISTTYITNDKKQTSIASLGILLGMAVYIFMNSLLSGFDRVSKNSVFKSTSHIRIYKEDEASKPLLNADNILIINPKIVPQSSRIINPNGLIQQLKLEKGVTIVTPQVLVSVFYNNGRSQLSGSAIGLLPEEGNQMFNIESFLVEGSINALKSNQNGVIIGSGIAKKMSLKTGDNISITSSKGVNKIMNIVGIFQMNNSKEDNSKSYINIAAAQQFYKEGNTFVTDINVNIEEGYDVDKYAEYLSFITNYKAESWKKAYETFVAADKMRNIIITFVSTTILLVAGFGIYNIINMTVSQKLNDIAILKAMGFKGNDVVQIFVTQAMIMGMIGSIGGVIAASIVVKIVQNVWVGGDIGYFPIDFEPIRFVQGVAFGLIVTFFAGYIPARKAAKVDPVSILRK